MKPVETKACGFGCIKKEAEMVESLNKEFIYKSDPVDWSHPELARGCTTITRVFSTFKSILAPA